MGCCLSKTDASPPPSIPNPNPDPDPKPVTTQVVVVEQRKQAVAPIEENQKEENEEETEAEVKKKKKKEIFVIQHRKSNDKRSDSDHGSSGSTVGSDPNVGDIVGSSVMAAAASGQAVRTSSCTKEEVDAILIQCGRLSRSSSGKGRKYSGSKRSFDFDRENDGINGGGGEISITVSNNSNNSNSNGEEDERLRRRQSRGSHRRRSTQSRSRERVDGIQRSGSRERVDQGSRRVSRSPGRRSESPLPNGSSNSNSNNLRPGKLVSVPATVNANNGDVKRVLVKRNVGSPRSQSPAKGNGNGGNQPLLSRNGSRKGEQSPYRRTPLNEIDMNSLPFQPLPNKRPMSKGKEVEEDGFVAVKSVSQNKYSDTPNGKAAGTHRRTNSRGAEGYEISKTNYCRVNELQTLNIEQQHLNDPTGYDAMVTPVIVSGSETLRLPQTLMRSRSSRRSRDLDINVDALLAPTQATDYNSLLLQDIKNFHQKNSSNTNGPVSLPPCVSKACSILEAVADLNSSSATAEIGTSFSYKKRVESKDPFVESEVNVGDDLMEPSFHKYVTVRQRGGGDPDGEESSGSNSFVGSAQNWVSSSSWEPNSADSTDCWTSKSYTREEGYNSSVPGCGIEEGSEKKFRKNAMEKFDQHQQQIGGARGRIAANNGRGPPMQASSKAAAAASM